MDILDKYRQIIEHVLSDYAAVPYANGKFETEVIFDQKRDRQPQQISKSDRTHHTNFISDRPLIVQPLPKRDRYTPMIALQDEAIILPKHLKIQLDFSSLLLI